MPIPVPGDLRAVRAGGSLGIVIGRPATRVDPARAYDHVAGYTVVNDVSAPHDSFHRPPLRHNCRDGFCPIGPWVVPREAVSDPAALVIRAYVNGDLRQQSPTSGLIRSIPQLLADISEFMTLSEGDILMIGVAENAPLVAPGDRVAIDIQGIGRLENPVIAEAELFAEAKP